MSLGRFTSVLLLFAVATAKGQAGYEPEPSLGPGLGGHRNDGIAIALIASSAAIGVANVVPQPVDGGARSLAVFGAFVGVASAVTGELLRRNDSARPSLAITATGFGIVTTTISAARLLKRGSSPATNLELAPSITLPSWQPTANVGFTARVRF